jgi:hypothetical protein
VGLRPKGKTFNLDHQAHRHRARLKVQGTVHSAKGLTWLDGTSIERSGTKKPRRWRSICRRHRGRIVFTAPAEGEADVRSTERIRMQLSRDLDPATLKDPALTYSTADSKGAAKRNRPRSPSRRLHEGKSRPKSGGGRWRNSGS